MKISSRHLIVAGLLLLPVLAGVAVWRVAHYCRKHTSRLVENYATRHGFPMVIGSAKWFGWHAVQLDNVRIGQKGEAARIDRVMVQWRWRSLLQHRKITSLSFDGPEIWTGGMGNLLRSLERESTDPSSLSQHPFEVDHVVIAHGILNLDDLVPGLPSIPVHFGEDHPVEFRHLPLEQSSTLNPNLIQKATAENVSITSPYDPLVKVLSFETINLYFTWNGLTNNRIEKLELKSPTVYIGPDLFWFADQIRAKSSAKDNSHLVVDQPGWVVHQLNLNGGHLVISGFGDTGVTLPFLFASTATDVHLDHIQDLSLKNEISILPEPIEYPSYNISLEPEKGTLNFNLPPDQSDANNLVQVVYFKRLAWREIEATNAWASFTFNEQGIFGRVGGEAYDGYLNGGFAIRFDAGYPWRAWGYVSGVNAQPVVEKLTRGRIDLELSGRASGRVEISALSTKILGTSVELQLQPPGQLKLQELDRFLEKLSASFSGVQRVGLIATVSSFEDYSYSRAQVTAHYQIPDSTARLELWGTQGHRVINLNWKQDPSQPPLSDLLLSGEDRSLLKN